MPAPLARKQDRFDRLFDRVEERVEADSPQEASQMSEELLADAIHLLTAVRLQGQSEDDYRRQHPERYRRMEQFCFTPEELLERRMERNAARAARKGPLP